MPAFDGFRSKQDLVCLLGACIIDPVVVVGAQSRDDAADTVGDADSSECRLCGNLDMASRIVTHDATAETGFAGDGRV